IQLSAKETEEALHECCLTILRATKQVLEQTPPELSADIVNKGIFLTGGGALLHNLDKFLEEGLGVPVFVAENALDC
ncbi:MAG: rod shape-determining protein, partial [Coprobacillus sp.]